MFYYYHFCLHSKIVSFKMLHKIKKKQKFLKYLIERKVSLKHRRECLKFMY